MKKVSSLEALRALQADSLGYALIRAAQLWNTRALAQANAQSGGGFREAHTRLIPHLLSPDGIRISELARRVDVTKQAAQQLVADLVDGGFARLQPDPDDARARRVVLTPQGIAASIAGTHVLLSVERSLSPTLGKADAKALRRLLRKLLNVLEADVDAP